MLLPAVFRQLDDAEKLIADARHFATKQTGELIPAAELPYPTMDEPRHGTAAEERGNADGRSQPRRRIEQPIEHEHNEESDEDADRRECDRFGELDRPNAAAKLTQLAAEPRWDFQLIVPLCLAHVWLLVTESANIRSWVVVSEFLRNRLRLTYSSLYQSDSFTSHPKDSKHRNKQSGRDWMAPDLQPPLNRWRLR